MWPHPIIHRPTASWSSVSAGSVAGADLSVGLTAAGLAFFGDSFGDDFGEGFGDDFGEALAFFGEGAAGAACKGR